MDTKIVVYIFYNSVASKKKRINRIIIMRDREKRSDRTKNVGEE